jgi:hypothetical protein
MSQDTHTSLPGLRGPITSLHRLRPSAPRGRCELHRRHQMEAELTGWLATAKAHQGPLRVTLVLPDDTRPLCPSQIVPPALECMLEAAQRRGGPIRAHVLIGSGLHKPPGDAFLQRLKRSAEMFRGQPLLEVAWSWHDARETERAGFPLNPRVMARARDGGGVDCVIAVGLVEPHQYAGFSGGLKGVSVGCGATSTIAALHSLELLRHPLTTIGQVKDNPFRRALNAVAAAHAAPTFLVNLVPDPAGPGFAGLFVGNSARAYDQAVALARRSLLVPLRKTFDFAILHVPPSKEGSFYQASRALTYLALHPSPVVRAGGALVLVASCPEGFGEGAGERLFRETLARGRARLLAELGGEDPPEGPLGGGAQRAYVLARALERFRCVLVGSPALPEAQAAGLAQVERLEQVEVAGAGLIVDDPFVMMPYQDTEATSFDRLIAIPAGAPGGAA